MWLLLCVRDYCAVSTLQSLPLSLSLSLSLARFLYLSLSLSLYQCVETRTCSGTSFRSSNRAAEVTHAGEKRAEEGGRDGAEVRVKRAEECHTLPNEQRDECTRACAHADACLSRKARGANASRPARHVGKAGTKGARSTSNPPDCRGGECGSSRHTCGNRPTRPAGTTRGPRRRPPLLNTTEHAER